MELRLTKLSDVPTIMGIIKDAQNYLAALHIDQWQDGYPNKEQIELDLKNKDSYVIFNNAKEVMGTTVFTTKKESTYQKIDGNWLTDNNAKYGVIHRLAVGDKYRKLGLAKFVFNDCEERLKELSIKSMRIDTHRDNKGMQYILTKRNYTYCGVIILKSGDERLAFEKLI
jgi:hypothetical protein